MFLFLFGGLVFLFPLAVYFLYLGNLNRRGYPVLVPGEWDFAGVLLALSGLICVGGPCILSSVQSSWRDFWMRGEFRELVRQERAQWVYWAALFGSYFVVVLAGSMLLLRGRRKVTAIYNAEARQVEPAFIRALGESGVRWERVGRRFFLDDAATAKVRRQGVAPALASWSAEQDGNVPASLHPPLESAGLSSDALGSLIVDVDPFPAFQHLTLRWREGADHPLRGQIEDRLARELGRLPAGPNLAAFWLMTAAFSLFCVLFLNLFLIGYALSVEMRRHGQVNPAGALDCRATRER